MKRLSVGILLSLAVTVCFAQTQFDHPEIYLGATVGVAASKVNFNPEVKQQLLNPKLGFDGGIGFRYIGNRNVGLQIELNYMQSGWKEESGYIRQLNYIEVPFMTHIYFGKEFRGFINLGPKIGVLAAESDKKQPEETQPQYKAADHKFDYGLCGGVGMMLNSRAGCYQLEARFGYSLGNIFSGHKTDTFSASNSMNLSLNFGWFWKVK